MTKFGFKKTLENFNPRTREGCDYVVLLNMKWLIYFNPRTREGCDVDNVDLFLRHRRISIHAPARGATVFLSPSPGFFHTAKSFLSVLSLFSGTFCEAVSALFCSARPLKASVGLIRGCSYHPIPWSRPAVPNAFPGCRFVWNLSLAQLYHLIWI